jgi:hypothetical protein
MADNFDLRKFLTENKLTKNAQLLKENTDVAQAFSKSGLTGKVTVVFYSDQGMGEPEIEVMNAQDALSMITSDVQSAEDTEDVIITQGNDIDQQGEFNPETQGLECVLEVAILDHGTYEVYKGTNNSQGGSFVMKEEQDYKYFDEEGTGGFYMTTIDGVKIYSLEDSSIMDTCFYALEEPETTYMISIDVSGEPVDADYVKQDSGVTGKVADFIVNDINSQLEEEGLLETSRSMKNKMNEAVTLNGKPVDINSIEIDGIDTSDYPDFVDAYIIAANYEDGTPLSDEELMSLEDENYGLAQELIFDKQLYTEGEEESGKKSEEDLSDDDFILFPLDKANNMYVPGGRWKEKKKLDNKVNEASYKTSANSKEAQYLKKGDIIGSGDEVVSVSAGAKTPSGKIEVTLKTKDGKTKTSTWGKTTKVGVKAKETLKENKMTKRDQYLTRLVENALQIHPSDDDELEFNPADAADELDYRRDQYQGNQMEEADDMVEEKPMPKYENIEKLMQEIEKSTDEEAHKFKVQEMRRVADGLEKKCTALEEGDNAEHIDQKKLKQMKKDIMTLRKGIEKMEKLGEKKFTKKETKAEMNEGFDLRKFLIENKLTRDSRMLNESELNELDANVQKLRDAFLAKLTAINKSQEELFNDDLFNVDKGARDLTKKYFMDKEKINNSWKELHNYVKGTTPPQLSGKPGAPPMPNLPPKPGAPTSGKPSPPPLPPGVKPRVSAPPLPPGVKPPLKTPPPINRNPTTSTPPGTKAPLGPPPINRRPALKTPPPINRKPTQR